MFQSILSLKKKFLPLLCLGALLMPCLATDAVSAEYPTKPIQIIIPWPPAGDTSTTIFTAMLPSLEKELGVPVKIVNKTGGGGVIGVNELVRSKPDGYSFGFCPIGPAVAQLLLGNTPYTADDFFPITLVYYNASVLAAKASAPYSNLEELAEYGKTNKLRLGISGIGDVRYLMSETIAQKGGFEWEAITFQDLNPLVLLQDSADVISYSPGVFKDYVANGDIKILATLLPERTSVFPDVPTAVEQGFGPAYAIWGSIFAPKGTPVEIAEKFRAAFVKALNEPEIQELMNNMGVISVGSSMEEAQERLAVDLETYKAIIDGLNVQ